MRNLSPRNGMFHATLLLLVGISIGCSKTEVEQPSESSNVSSGQSGKSLRIGMMPKLVGIGYFDATQKGAEEAAKELGIKLIYDGPTDARSEDQIRMIDGWLAQGVDVVAVAPNDPEAISATLKNAKEIDATVLTWDTDANPEKSQRATFVNQAENQEIGKGLVDLMVKGIEERGQELKGDFLIVSGTATAANQNNWIKIMSDILKKDYPGINLLPTLTPGEDQQKAYEQTAEALSAYKDLKGIWGLTSVALPAAAKATRDAKRLKEVVVTGLSLPDLMREYVKDGSCERFLLWDAVDLGYLTIHVAKALHENKLQPGTHDFGRLKGIEVRESEVILGKPVVFDKSNIDKYQF